MIAGKAYSALLLSSHSACVLNLVARPFVILNGYVVIWNLFSRQILPPILHELLSNIRRAVTHVPSSRQVERVLKLFQCSALRFWDEQDHKHESNEI